MHNKIEIKMENYSAKLTEFNKFIPLLLRSEDLSKMDQDKPINKSSEVYT